MYGWLKDNNDIWGSGSANPGAVVFSSASRDFVDRNTGVVLVTGQVGQKYYQTDDAAVTTAPAGIMEATGRTIVTDAAAEVLIDLRQRTEHRLDVLFANIDGLDGPRARKRDKFTVSP